MGLLPDFDAEVRKARAWGAFVTYAWPQLALIASGAALTIAFTKGYSDAGILNLTWLWVAISIATFTLAVMAIKKRWTAQVEAEIYKNRCEALSKEITALTRAPKRES